MNATGVRPKRSLFGVLLIPAVDKTIAVVACLPLVWLVYLRFQAFGVDLPRLTLAINILVVVGTMLARRAPVRVTPNPLFWLLAFVATYWQLLTIGIMSRGHPIAPNWVTDGLAILSVGIIVWARLSLGRNIGFVPAQRTIVTHGAYRYMRHPIYTGIFVSVFAVALRSYTPSNALLLALGIFWLVIKSFVEEYFLRRDPEYAAYLEHVRWRWLPGVV
jgi:protein-S-isoprenylcysteine O-methyltransferase Ste14